MTADKCNDEFRVVMHEFSFYCDKPAGHDGGHSCTVVIPSGREDTFSTELRRERGATYSAMWDR
jgi:hypothetical protein